MKAAHLKSQSHQRAKNREHKAFTSVSEPPADGWTLYRRNAPLWLAVFVLASSVATLLALGLI